MSKKILVSVVSTLLLASAHLAEAQQAKKIPTIGVLRPGSPSPPDPLIQQFRQGLRELGYLEGKNILIEYRYAEGKSDRLPDLAAELVRIKVDVIVTTDTPAIRAARRATTTIPIVMANVADPVATGLIASLARPGGNITGLSNLAPDLDQKRLELLKETLPKATRVALIWQSGPDAKIESDTGRGSGVGVEASGAGGARCRRTSERI